jgi:hypothetical protein
MNGSSDSAAQKSLGLSWKPKSATPSRMTWKSMVLRIMRFVHHSARSLGTSAPLYSRPSMRIVASCPYRSRIRRITAEYRRVTSQTALLGDFALAIAPALIPVGLSC